MRRIWIWIAAFGLLFLLDRPAAPTAHRPPSVTVKLQALADDSCLFVGLPAEACSTSIVFHRSGGTAPGGSGWLSGQVYVEAWTADCTGVAFGPDNVTALGRILRSPGLAVQKYYRVNDYLATAKLWPLEGSRHYVL